MKIVIDDKIPFLRGVLEPFGRVTYLDGRLINHESVKEADALFVRTRTTCKEELLKGSSLKFLATATIGTDHIDTLWCEANGIKWTNAPGCNSGSVMQYITSAILYLSDKYGFDVSEKTIGIVGVGNVGKKVDAMARAIGMNVLLNDPPRYRTEGKGAFVSLDRITEEADIITFHVPLTHTGEDKSYHLAGADFFKKLKSGTIIINSSRGGVIDELRLTESLLRGSAASAVIDVWENEPKLNLDLMNITDLATPHIAGYSIDGKWNASNAVLKAFCEFFKVDISECHISTLQSPADDLIDTGDDMEHTLSRVKKAVFNTYNIVDDSIRLKTAPGDFEILRNNYRVRREFAAYRASGIGETADLLARLGFRVE